MASSIQANSIYDYICMGGGSKSIQTWATQDPNEWSNKTTIQKTGQPAWNPTVLPTQAPTNWWTALDIKNAPELNADQIINSLKTLEQEKIEILKMDPGSVRKNKNDQYEDKLIGIYSDIHLSTSSDQQKVKENIKTRAFILWNSFDTQTKECETLINTLILQQKEYIDNKDTNDVTQKILLLQTINRTARELNTAKTTHHNLWLQLSAVISPLSHLDREAYDWYVSKIDQSDASINKPTANSNMQIINEDLKQYSPQIEEKK